MHELVIKSGALVSVAGIGLFVAFVSVLLLFPVVKSCKIEESDCDFASTAPEPFRSLVQPAYLAISLLLVASGVFVVRFERWRESKKTEGL